MSADNGVYIAKFPDGFRVCYGAAIENVTYYPVGSEERKDQQKLYFDNGHRFDTEQEAILFAHEEAKKYVILEYGVSFLGELEGWDGMIDVAEEPKKEEWYHIRNEKPTEMQLWGGEKKICNLQGRWTEELAEFIRMANLGIIVHREEIKRRVESMLEHDPKDVAFNRGEQPSIQQVDESPFVPDTNRFFTAPGMTPIFQRTETIQESEQPKDKDITQIELCGVVDVEDQGCNVVVSPDTLTDEEIDNACHYYSVYKRHVDGRAIHMVDAPKGTKRQEAIATASKLARDFNVPFKDETVFHVSL